MAVTIVSFAQTHTPAYNNQYLVASSTNAAQTNFKYVVTVEINGGTSVENTTLEVPPRPDNGFLYYNPQRIARSSIKTEFHKDETTFFIPSLTQPSELKKVTVGIDEKYGSPVSGFGGVSSSYFIWNASYKNLSFADYVYSTTTSAKDLTLVPSLIDTIKYEQKYLFKTWHKGFSTRDLRYLYIESFDSSNNTIQVVTFENPSYTVGAGSYNRNFLSLNVSPYGINNFSGTITAKTNIGIDNIPSNAAKYTMYFLDSSPAISSNTYTVNIDTMCSKFSRYVLHFLNTYGNWDSFTFNKLSRYNTDKDSDMFKKIPYSLNSVNKYTYDKSVNDTVVYNTVLTNKMTLNSNFINETQASWFWDLLTSADIKLENSSGDIISVKCTNKNYESKKKVNDKLFNITSEIENSLQDTRQGA